MITNTLRRLSHSTTVPVPDSAIITQATAMARAVEAACFVSEKNTSEEKYREFLEMKTLELCRSLMISFSPSRNPTQEEMSVPFKSEDVTAHFCMALAAAAATSAQFESFWCVGVFQNFSLSQSDCCCPYASAAVFNM
jgi:hypothetical protein